jgi:hypothetical protein
MNWKIWTISFLVASLGLIAPVPAVNLYVDPFDIFHTNFLKRPYQLNERFNKIQFLDKHHDRFNSYMFGSSRIGTTDPASVQKYIPNSRFYNFTLSAATNYDHLLHLKYFLKEGYPIQNLYLQIDIPDQLKAYEPKPDDYLRKFHPHVVGRDLPSYYLEYLTIRPLETLKGKWELNEQNKDYMTFDIEGTGRFFRGDYERRIAQNHEEYIKSEPTFHENLPRTIKNDYMKPNIDALREIKRLCDENNIRLIVFTTPHHHRKVDSVVIEDYLSFLREISKITDFWDFGGYNSITLDDHNYYEFSHYRPYIGDMIAARIFGDKSVKIPDDFGVFITKQNIENRIQFLRQQMIARDAAR